MVLKVICAIFIPPLAAFLQVGVTKHFWINIVLCLLSFGILGLVHALWLIFTEQKA